MNTTTIALLLQMTASLLSGAQKNPSLPTSTGAALVALGSRTVQIATQAEAKINVPAAGMNGIWPNIAELTGAAYWNPVSHKYVNEGGSGVALLENTASFGDLNGDGLDDAAAIVKPAGYDGDYLAMFLNQGGTLFNIADISLDSPVTLYSHHIVGNMLTMDMKGGLGPRATSTYWLLGNQIFKR